MKKKTIMKRKISKECWDLDDAFLVWLYEHLKVYLKEASKVVDLNYHKFTYKDEELTQEEIIRRLITLLEEVKTLDTWLYEKEYCDKCDEILDLWKLVFYAMWW